MSGVQAVHPTPVQASPCPQKAPAPGKRDEGPVLRKQEPLADGSLRGPIDIGAMLDASHDAIPATRARSRAGGTTPRHLVACTSTLRFAM